MEEIILQATNRDVIGKQVRALRRQGNLPAVLYGRNFKPIPVSLSLQDTSKVMPYISSSQLVVIDLEGDRHTALVRDKQIHPVKGTLEHVDFLIVSMTETLKTLVSIELQGDSPAVKELGGVLVVGQSELEVESLPQDLPERIYVDISVLKEIGDALYVNDIPAIPNVEVLADPEEMIALITYAEVEVEEEEEIEEEEEFEAEPEVIERGKKEEDIADEE